jgi:cell surface protein SprA
MSCLPRATGCRSTSTLDQLTALKFPDDYPGARRQQIVRGAQIIQQVVAMTHDARDPSVPLQVTLRGSPTLASLTRFFVGVRHRHGGLAPPAGVPPGAIAGEAWFDNVRLDNVEQTVGFSQQYSMAWQALDVFDLSANSRLARRRVPALRQRAGAGSDLLAWQGRVATEMSRLVPTLGFNIPVTYTYGRDRTLPKFFSQSDTRNTPERKMEQRSENVRDGIGVSVRSGRRGSGSTSGRSTDVVHVQRVARARPHLRDA